MRNLQTLQLGELAVRYSPAKPDKPAGGLCPGHCTARPSSSHVLSTRPHVHVASPCVFPQLSSTRPRCTDKPSPGSVLAAPAAPSPHASLCLHSRPQPSQWVRGTQCLQGLTLLPLPSAGPPICCLSSKPCHQLERSLLICSPYLG